MKRRTESAGGRRKREAIFAYLMIAPLMAGVLLFYIGAFFKNLYYGFTDKGSFGDAELIGIKNYMEIAKDGAFLRAAANTALYALFCVPAVLLLSVLLALLLNVRLKGIGLFRVCIFLPAVTLPSAIGLIWRWMMNYEFGLFNEIRALLSLKRIAWLSDPNYALFSVSLVFIWANVAYPVIILLAGLQSIPSCYREAAQIDGAGRWRQFTSITLPLLSPVIFFVLITTVINVLQIFDFIYLMIPEGSIGMASARSLVSYFFRQSFVMGHRGYGAAVSVILFLLILLVTMLLMFLQKRIVFYDD